MPCVVSTPFGFAVEPDVKMIFANVSGPTVACAASTPALPSLFSKSANVDAPPAPLRATTFSIPSRNGSASAAS